ncbi:MAG: hypothetical protein WCT04_13135 [Planctomycetota bacterium]
MLISAAALAVLLVVGIWLVTRPSARDPVATNNRGSTVNVRDAAATSNTAPVTNTTEQNPQALKERCFEWLGNWRNAINGAQPTWEFSPQSEVEQGDRELLKKKAAHTARMSAEARAMREATSGSLSTEPLPPKIEWTTQDSEKFVALRDKISEWGYAVLCETKNPAMAAKETAARMGAGRVEDILKAKHAGDASTSTTDGNLTFEAVDQPLQKVAEFLETLTKQKVSVDPALAEKVISIKIDGLKLNEALKRIATAASAELASEKGTYFLSPKGKLPTAVAKPELRDQEPPADDFKELNGVSFPFAAVEANGKITGLAGITEFKFGLFPSEFKVIRRDGGVKFLGASDSFFSTDHERLQWPEYAYPKVTILKRMDEQDREKLRLDMTVRMQFHRRSGLVVLEDDFDARPNEFMLIVKKRLIDAAVAKLGQPKTSRQDENHIHYSWVLADGSRLEMEEDGDKFTRCCFAKNWMVLRGLDELGGAVLMTDGKVPEKPMPEIRATVELKGHTNEITKLAFNPESTVLASASRDKTICLWDAKTGALLHRLIGHKEDILDFAFLPGNKLLSLGSRDDLFLRLWDMGTGKEIKKVAAKEGGSLHVCYDGRYGVINRGRMFLRFSFDAATAEKEQPMTAIKSVSMNPRNYLMAAVEDTITVWSVDTGKLQYALGKFNEFSLQQHQFKAMKSALPDEQFVHATFSPDGSELATVSKDYRVRIHIAQTGAVKRELAELINAVKEVFWLEDGTLITQSSEGVAAWNAATGQKALALGDKNRSQITPSGDRSFALFHSYRQRNSCSIFDAPSKSMIPLAMSESVYKMPVISDDRKCAAYIGHLPGDGQIKLFLAVLDDPSPTSRPQRAGAVDLPTQDTAQPNKAAPDSKNTQPLPVPVSDPKAKALTAMMQNYLKAHQLDKAKEYAKKIVDGFPGALEADEAKTVLQMGN